MDHDILENTIEEVTEGDKAQNDSSARVCGSRTEACAE